MSEFNRVIQEFLNLEMSDVLFHLGQFLLWAAFILLVFWLIRKAINRTITDNNLRYRVRKAARLISYLLILLLIIITFTGKVQYFTIAIGLISAGIAFALQEVILSFAGWVSIFSTGLYKPGDRIEMNGVKGDVIDIGITRTTLMEIGEWVRGDNYSGRIVQLSNGFVFKGPVHNYSTDFPFVWDEISLPIRYDSDLQLARSFLIEIAHTELDEYARYAREHWDRMIKKYLIEAANVEPMLFLQLTDNWIEFNLRYVVDYKKRKGTRHKLHTRIHEAIRQSEGKVLLASATFEVTAWPDINVNIPKNRQE